MIYRIPRTITQSKNLLGSTLTHISYCRCREKLTITNVNVLICPHCWTNASIFHCIYEYILETINITSSSNHSGYYIASILCNRKDWIEISWLEKYISLLFEGEYNLASVVEFGDLPPLEPLHTVVKVIKGRQEKNRFVLYPMVWGKSYQKIIFYCQVPSSVVCINILISYRIYCFCKMAYFCQQLNS